MVCGDFNCQLVENLPFVGQYGCTVERSADSVRACHLHGALQSNDLKVHSTFHNIGPTRHPWPQAAARGEQPTVVDSACASSKLHSRVFIPPDFPEVTRSDHTPVATHLLAPKSDKKKRRRTMEALLRKSSGQLPARWEPRNRDDFRQEIQQIISEALQHLTSQAVQRAQRHTQYAIQEDPVRSDLLKGLREASNPITQRA